MAILARRAVTRALCVSASALALSLSASAASAYTYVVQHLPSGFNSGGDINDLGVVGGRVGLTTVIIVPNGGPAPYDTVTTTVSLPGIAQSVAINNSNQLALQGSGTPASWFYDPATGIATTLPPLSFGNVNATSLNDSGVVAGGAALAGGQSFQYRPYEWSAANGGGQAAPYFVLLNGISNDGWTAGQTSSGAFLPAYFQAGSDLIHLIKDTGFGGANAINDSHQVVGFWGATLPLTQSVPFFFDGTFHEIDDGRLQGSAADINDLGVVVGTSFGNGSQYAWMWTLDGGIVDLDTLIDPSLGYHVLDPVSINNLGQILAYVDTGELSKYVVLSPISGGGGAVPEPSVWATLIAGFGLVGWQLRRRRLITLG